MNQEKLEEYRRKYPKGTVVELTAPIREAYSPKPAGAKFKVDYVDDMAQLQGTWLAPQTGSIAIIIGEDSFKVVK
ncbi:MAG: DUF4314 domain-containing protein [Lachnospiraceae bacterium]|nr:DUF4314 domain-containing protein [Lachnospiraceae bacterium]